MYRTSSPIFDVPEFPPLRRVKPLPKRKRTPGQSAAPPQDLSIVAAPTPDNTPGDLIAHADSFSAQMALQTYYMPILGDIQNLNDDGLQNNRATTGTPAATTTPVVDLSAGYGIVGSRSGIGFVGGCGLVAGQQRDDDGIRGGGDGDYIDHLQQPGNTKKRKVPANMSGSRHHFQDTGSGNSGAEDDAGFNENTNNRGIPTGRPDAADAALDIFPPAAVALSSTVPQQLKAKMSAATLAGLHHKEMLKSRKRQLTAVLGALSHGDTLALDQALSARYPFGLNGDLKGGETVRIRLSTRTGPRLSRAAKTRHANAPENSDGKTFKIPSRKFTFVCRSATSERLVATREEVAILHSRFEAELARQAAKAAEAAKQAVSAISNGSPNSKRGAGSKQGLHSGKALNGRAGDQPSVGPNPSPSGAKRGGKKKKRSALANASNPHHLRNYVPSRLPNSGQTHASQGNTNNVNSQSYLGTPALRFLSAQIPPRRRRGGSGPTVTAASTLTNPAEEWICPQCEYNLFYGEELGYLRAVKSRKKILKRRRRARERAAAAASGKAPMSTTPDRVDTSVFDDGNKEAEFEGPYAKDAVPGAAYKPPRWKVDTGEGGNTATEQYSQSLD